MTRRNHPTEVQVGQYWSVLFMRGGSRARVEVRITHIAPDSEIGLIAHGVSTATGKAFRLRVVALANHLRGARLVQHADGQRVTAPPRAAAAPEKEEPPRVVTTKLPRGLRPLTPRDILIRELRAQGLSVRVIARRADMCEKRVRDAFENLDDWAIYEGDDGVRTIA